MKISKNSRMTAVFAIAALAVMVGDVAFAKKGGRGGGGSGETNSPPPADVVFRDAVGDTIASDGLGPYMDGVAGIRATTQSEVGDWSLHLFTPDGTDRSVIFDLSQLSPSSESTPTSLIPDGVGEIQAMYTTPKDLPAPGQTINGGIGSIFGTFLNPDAPAGVSDVTLYFYSSKITAIDANTFVWEVSPTDVVEINETSKKYRGNKVVTDQFFMHGTYTNCAFAVVFTKRN